MTSYWKPRWPATVLFGSWRELRYRIDIGREQPTFRLRIGQGPGFTLNPERAAGELGFDVAGSTPKRARAWLNSEECRRAAATLLASHFHRLELRPDHVHRLEEFGLRGGVAIRMFQPGNPCIIHLDGNKVCLRADAYLQVLVEPAPN